MVEVNNIRQELINDLKITLSKDVNAFKETLIKNVNFIRAPISTVTNDAIRWANNFAIPLTLNGDEKADFRGNNDMRDAFRHAYASGLIAMEIKNFFKDKLLHPMEIILSIGFTKLIGELIEEYRRIKGDNPELDKEMDLFNNEVGIKIGILANSEQEVANKVFDALMSGKLKFLVPEDEHIPFEDFDSSGNPLFIPIFDKNKSSQISPRKTNFALKRLDAKIINEVRRQVKRETQMIDSNVSAAINQINARLNELQNFSPFPSRGITNKSRGQIGKEMWQMLAKGLRNM